MSYYLVLSVHEKKHDGKCLMKGVARYKKKLDVIETFEVFKKQLEEASE